MGEVYTGTATDTVGKKELAAVLGWSRPTLDKRLKTDPRFPVVSRGDQSGGWAFRVADVQSYLAGRAIPAAPIDRAQLRDAVRPTAAPAPPPGEPFARRGRRSAHHEGEATARQRKDAADASLKEDRLARERGELVPRDLMRQVSGMIVANLAANFDSLAGEIVKRQNLPVEMEPAIQAQLDEMRRSWVAQALASLEDELRAETGTADG